MAHRLSDPIALTDHGGNLAEAEALFPEGPRPWLDLSTGINPHSYPLFELPATVFTRLPEPAHLKALVAAAANAYGAPSPDHIVPAAGTQALLPLVLDLVPQGIVHVLSPTYSEHRQAAELAGRRITEVDRFEQLFGADIAILVNPNNPDGKMASRVDILRLAGAMKDRGGLVLVDEAFMDVGPAGESVARDVANGGIVVLRSFGKFFGLAGVRLAFAIAVEEIAARLAARLGPWPVSGPALAIGLRALDDRNWQAATRARLAVEMRQLDSLLAKAGLAVAGGTSLFRQVQSPAAANLFRTLGQRGIFVRRFDHMPDAIRFGLPGEAEAFTRLAHALHDWQSANHG